MDILKNRKYPIAMNKTMEVIPIMCFFIIQKGL
jgi:hypothetical protein